MKGQWRDFGGKMEIDGGKKREMERVRGKIKRDKDKLKEKNL